ncbi:MAG: pyridoxal-dependent decarboxylase [Ilumatobacteraceae bacterium]
MHVWDDQTDLFAHSVIGYAIERLQRPKDTRWGQHPAGELNAALEGTITAAGIGGIEALHLFRDVLLPACRPIDDPMCLAYVATAPSIAATMFDLVVSASSIFAGLWEGGAGAIAAENQALRWLADLAGFPAGAGGVFVSGGSAANLSALVAARQRHTDRHGRPARFRFAATTEVHASVKVATKVMDVDIIEVQVDDRGRMTGAALADALDALDGLDRAGAGAGGLDGLDRAGAGAGAGEGAGEHDGSDGVFAVVANGGTTNAGAIDDLPGVADVCAERGLWMHVDGAYGGAALACAEGRRLLTGIERADSFGLDPHKWLFAPYDCAALVYRDPAPAAAAHSQHGDYLELVDRGEWNPSDYAYHLTRRARGLPLWFSVVTYGTDAYAAAVQRTMDTVRGFADAVAAHPSFELLVEPTLSIALFTRNGWGLPEYTTWSRRRAAEGKALVVPTNWHGAPCMRVCVVNPRTELAAMVELLDDMASFDPAAH